MSKFHFRCPACGHSCSLSEDEFPFTCRCRHRCGEPDYAGVRASVPSITRRLSNLARATAAHLVNGARTVDDFTRAWRLSRCRSCPLFDAAVETCTHPGCGCGMRRRRGVVDALGWASKDCPIGRWDFEPVTKRNLIYHVFALRDNDDWRHNLARLRERWGVFNGKKVIAMAVGERSETVTRVHRELRGLDYEFFSLANSVELREAASFPRLLEAVRSEDPAEASFYAHTKGNTTAGHVDAVRWWRNGMYRRLLDERAWSSLARHPMVGCHKIAWPEGSHGPFPTAQPTVPEERRIRGIGNFMFAGTFFWFRHDAVFTNPRWRDVPVDRYGAEAWPSVMFRWHDVRSVWQKWPENAYPTPSPYNPSIYTQEERLEDGPLAQA